MRWMSLVLVVIITIVVACSTLNKPDINPAPIPDPSPSPIPSPSPFPEFSGPMPLKGWDDAYDAFIASHLTPDVLALDISSLCPHADDKKKALIDIFHAISFAESGYDRMQRYVETGLGTDRMTGEQNTSEGLLQLGQQDEIFYKCPFTWATDKLLPDWKHNPDRSIFNPYRNLECGIMIFVQLAKNYGLNSFQDIGRKYWSVLRVERGGFQSFKRKLIELNGGCK